VLYSVGRLAPAHLTDPQRRTIERMARLHLAGYVAIAASAVMQGSWWPIYYWLGPFVALHWVYRLQGFGEHTFLTHRPHTLLNTRTLETNALMRLLNWNMTYHTVHHTYPSVPFYRLPELHREVEEKLGVPPHKVADYLAMVGDVSDNIPGIKGVGPKTATKLLSQFESLDDILENTDQIERERLRNLIDEYRDEVQLSRDLVALRPPPGLEVSREKFELGEPDYDQLRDIFDELEFGRLIKQLGGRRFALFLSHAAPPRSVPRADPSR